MSRFRNHDGYVDAVASISYHLELSLANVSQARAECRVRGPLLYSLQTRIEADVVNYEEYRSGWHVREAFEADQSACHRCRGVIPTRGRLNMALPPMSAA